VIVSHVVTSQYVRTSCALSACNASLGSVPRFPLDGNDVRADAIPFEGRLNQRIGAPRREPFKHRKRGGDHHVSAQGSALAA
jgi:hypothetical protein